MTPATAAKVIAFLAGASLMVWIAAQTDLGAVAQRIAGLGWEGGLVVSAVFLIGFTADVGAWLVMLPSLPVSVLGAWRLWLVQMVGEGLNTLTPFGSLGGEPVKAMLLKHRYGIGYREGTASLLLNQTLNTFAEVPFVAVGLAIMVHSRVLPPTAEAAMVIGAACVAGFIVLVLAALHLRWLAALERVLARHPKADGFARALAAVRDIEQRLFTFVRHEPGRFGIAFALSFLTWVTGAAEIYAILWFLGTPVTWQDAWLVEAGVVLVRNATFFVPAHMGTQDAVTVLIVGAITGSPELGLAVALVRRGRELAWAAAGIAIGGWFGAGALRSESGRG
jgi:uncharacterized protein (TIRG00374 family)